MTYIQGIILITMIILCNIVYWYKVNGKTNKFLIIFTIILCITLNLLLVPLTIYFVSGLLDPGLSQVKVLAMALMVQGIPLTLLGMSINMLRNL